MSSSTRLWILFAAGEGCFPVLGAGGYLSLIMSVTFMLMWTNTWWSNLNEERFILTHRLKGYILSRQGTHGGCSSVWSCGSFFPISWCIRKLSGLDRKQGLGCNPEGSVPSNSPFPVRIHPQRFHNLPKSTTKWGRSVQKLVWVGDILHSNKNCYYHGDSVKTVDHCPGRQKNWSLKMVTFHFYYLFGFHTLKKKLIAPVEPLPPTNVPKSFVLLYFLQILF